MHPDSIRMLNLSAGILFQQGCRDGDEVKLE
jgi:hypothetical protein